MRPSKKRPKKDKSPKKVKKRSKSKTTEPKENEKEKKAPIPQREEELPQVQQPATNPAQPNGTLPAFPDDPFAVDMTVPPKIEVTLRWSVYGYKKCIIKRFSGKTEDKSQWRAMNSYFWPLEMSRTQA